MFTELESKILEIAQKHFNEKISKDELEIIEKHGWGHENWFQNELLIALNRAGLDTKTLSKKGKDADLVIETEGKNIGIELRTTVKGRTPRLIKALSQHKNAEIYLFLTQISQTAPAAEIELDYSTIEKIEQILGK